MPANPPPREDGGPPKRHSRCTAWPAVASAGTGSVLAWLGRAQSTVTLIALLVVAGAWLSVGVQSRRSRTRPARTTIYAMSAATLVLTLAILWPRIEPFLLRLLSAAWLNCSAS
jgi:hypothetical protein